MGSYDTGLSYLQGVPYKTQPNTVNNLFIYFFQRYRECDKQRKNTGDAENVSHLFEEKHTLLSQGVFCKF